MATNNNFYHQYLLLLLVVIVLVIQVVSADDNDSHNTPRQNMNNNSSLRHRHRDESESEGEADVDEPDKKLKELLSRPEKQTRIINGNQVKELRYPYFALLTSDQISTEKFRCGAVVIGPRLVLSVAHCDVFDMDQMSFQIGAYKNLTDGRTVKINSKTIHPQYNETEFLNDIVIYQLEANVSLSLLLRFYVLHRLILHRSVFAFTFLLLCFCFTHSLTHSLTHSHVNVLTTISDGFTLLYRVGS